MGPRSNFGSQAHLFSQNGYSQTNPYNALRFAVKVLQIDPPESDEEHYSLDSKDPHSLENEKKIGSSKQQVTKFGDNYKSPVSKDLKGQETPANGFDDLLEIPLKEEPMPEQKSIGKKNGFKKQVELIRASNNFDIGAQEMPQQPVAHDDPPIGIDTSKHSVSPIACRVINMSKGTTPKIGQDGWNEEAQGPHEAFKQLKLAANTVTKVDNGIADVDAVHNNGMPSQQDQDSYSDTGGVQFPQDVLFTNVNSSKHAFIGQANNFEEHTITHHDDLIMRDGDEEYVKMKQELQDSNVYFFNHLRREFDNEERAFRLSEPKQEEQDQTSFPCISAFIEKQGSIQRSSDAVKSTFQNKHSRVASFTQIETNRNAAHQRILKNQKSDLNISPNRFNERRDDSFFIEKAQDDTRLVRGSIAVDSADFGESRLLKTERKVLHQAEILKENVKVQNGNWLQQRIDMAKPNEVIYLESTTYKFTSLFIDTPVTLYGQPETILEVDGGSIFVGFRKLDNLEEADLDDEENIVNATPFAGYESNLFSNQALKSHPLNRGTPLTIKKNKVARIQICEIRFNRTKASLQAIVAKQQQARPQSPAKPQRGRSPVSRQRGLTTAPHQENEPQFSHEISLGATQNNPHVGQPSLTMLQINTSNNMVGVSNTNNNTLLHPIAGESQTQLGQAGAVSCFVIEQKSFIEVKDCCIKSIKDKKNFDQEMDLFFRGSKAGFGQSVGLSGYHTNPIANEKTATNDQIIQEKYDFLEQMRRQDNEIQDYCFIMNLPEESTGHSNVAEYSGLVSLCSTTIQNFMFGVYCGADAILTSESSSFIALRAGGCAIKSYRPKLLKFMNGSIQKCEAHGIQITLDEMPLQYAPFSKALSHSPREKADFGQATSLFAAPRQRSSTKQSNNNAVYLTEQIETENDAAHASLLQKLARKIYIENNRIVQVQGCPIMIEGPATDHYLQYFIKVKDNRISNCGTEAKLYSIPGATDKEKEEEIQLVKQAFAHIGGQPPPACILLKNLHIFYLNCFRNTISKGSGSGITIFNVKGNKEDMTQVTKLPTTEQDAQTVFDLCVGDQQRVTVVDNYVIETADGYGMIIDSSTCHLELNQLKKNALGGLMITSSQRRGNTQGVKAASRPLPQEAFETARSFGAEAGQNSPVLFTEQRKNKQTHKISKQSALRISQIKRFCSINIDNSTAVNNLKFGIGVFNFYGTVTIKNTQCNENETDGLIFSRRINSRYIVGLNERLEDEAQYIDYADFTDRSSKFPQNGGNRSRSPTLVQATEKSMIEGNMTSYRQEEGYPERQDNSTLLERPFEKQVGTVYLLKCTVQQNRGDGIKSVDCAIESLGCTIQGNMSSAIRLCEQDRGAELQIYLTARNNDSDLIGHVLGQNGTRFNPKMKVDSNLQQLLKDLIRVQMLQAYVEMIQMSQEEAADLRTQTLQKSTEQKLISQVETQKTIIEQRDPPQNKGFFSFLKCCSSVKASSSNNSAKKPAQLGRPGIQSQTEAKPISLNSQPEKIKRINRQK